MKQITIVCTNEPCYIIQKVDIKFSAHDAFLEQPLSGVFKVERLESEII